MDKKAWLRIQTSPYETIIAEILKWKIQYVQLWYNNKTHTDTHRNTYNKKEDKT